MKKYEKKYMKGRLIEDLEDFCQLHELGFHFYFNHKFMHNRFIANWSIFQIKSHIGRFWVAERT